MTKIYIYCLFDSFDRFLGVYSSLKAVHRDALRHCNKGTTPIYFLQGKEGPAQPSLTSIRNFFKGKCDVVAEYRSDRHGAKIFKTKLQE